MKKRLILYNIEYCEGMKGSKLEYLKFWRYFSAPKQLDDKILYELKQLNPDILALVEVDAGSFRSRKRDEGQYFHDELKMKGLIEEVKYPKTSWLKLFRFIPILRKQSNALMSKYPFSFQNYELLHEGTKRLILHAKAKVPQEISLFLVHLALGPNTRKKQIQELTHKLKNCKTPFILMGDFNTFKGLEEIKTLLHDTKLELHSSKTKNNFTEPTYNPSKTLDYVLTSSQIKVHSYNVLNFPFSDHLPVVVDFELKEK